MKGEGIDFLSTAETEQILSKEPDHMEKIIEDTRMGKHALEKLLTEEKDSKGRSKVINSLSDALAEEKVLESLEDLIQHLDDTYRTLDKVEVCGNDKNMDKVAEKTVKNLRSYLNKEELTERQIERLLEKEKSGKDRKTAKKLIKGKMNSDKSSSSLEELREDISSLESDVESFESKFSSSRSKFILEELKEDRYQERKDRSEEESITDITEKALEVLRRDSRLRKSEKVKSIVNDAFLALEADNYDTFKRKMRSIEDLDERNNSTGHPSNQPEDKQSDATEKEGNANLDMGDRIQTIDNNLKEIEKAL